MNRDIVLIDPRKRIDIHNADVIARHALYAKALINGQKKELWRLVVIQPSSTGDSGIIHLSDNLSVLQIDKFYFKLFFKRNFFKQIAIQYSLNPKLLSVGDPDVSYVVAKIFEKTFNDGRRTRLPLYVQVHSELNWKIGTSGLIQFLKFCLAGMAVRNATRIRATSNVHKSQISELFKISSEKIDSIPVPLTENNFGNKGFKFPRPESLAFVGRLHEERNPEIFLTIAAAYCATNSQAKVLVIGDGPKRTKIEAMAKKLPCANQIEFYGELDSKSLADIWQEIGVLVSTAKHESYGRSNREALFNGVPVLALDSLGSRSLAQEAPLKWVELVKNVSNSDELIIRINRLLKLRIDETYRDAQLEIQRNIPSRLAESWLRTITIDT
jgi:glycosyltransferase involved in cell wall biosynthesis